jgi:hypothetical protein
MNELSGRGCDRKKSREVLIGFGSVWLAGPTYEKSLKAVMTTEEKI